MACRLTDRTDKLLVKLDRQYGKDAVYHSITAGTADVVTGDMTHTDDPIPVRVRSAELNSMDISELRRAGLDQLDAAWLMRSAYKSDVKSGDLITVSAFDYEIIDQGSSLDSLNLLWTIYTRRRR